jgi:hypothetical protein
MMGDERASLRSAGILGGVSFSVWSGASPCQSVAACRLVLPKISDISFSITSKSSSCLGTQRVLGGYRYRHRSNCSSFVRPAALLFPIVRPVVGERPKTSSGASLDRKVRSCCRSSQALRIAPYQKQGHRFVSRPKISRD